MSNTRTVNGRPIGEILNLLKQPLEHVAEDRSNNLYLPKDLVDERLDEILGLNYSFELISNPELITIGDKQCFVSSGKMTIYDDEGILVGIRTAGNGHNVIFKTSDGRAKDISNDYSSCISSVKKKCAKEFGLGRYLSLNDPAKKSQLQKYTADQVNRNKGASSGNTKKNNSDKKVIDLQLKSKFNTFNTCLKATVLVPGSSESHKLVIFNKDHDTIGRNKVDQLIGYPIGKKVRVKVTENKWKNEHQYILKDIAIS